MVIRFNQLGSGVGGILIYDRWGLVGVVYVPGAHQEKLEPMGGGGYINIYNFPKLCPCICQMELGDPPLMISSSEIRTSL